MSLLKRKRVLAAKIEGTAGTAETLANADVLYGAYDVMVQPNIPFEQRMAGGSGSQDVGTLGAYAGTCTFKTELRGDGAGGIPAWASTLLPACGYVASAQVYSPRTEAPGTNVKTLTIASYQDGKKKFLRGAVGDCSIAYVSGSRIVIDWTFQGVWQAPVDADVLSTAASYGTAFRWSNSTFTIGGSAPGCAETMTIAFGNAITMRPCPTPSDGSGIETGIITGRRPTINLDPEARTVTNENVYGKWLSGNEEALSVAVTDGTDTITIAAPKTQRVNVQEGDRNEIETDQIELQCNKSAAAGNDELSITFA